MKRDQNQIFKLMTLAALFLGAFFILPKFANSALALPLTSCDPLIPNMTIYGNSVHITSGMNREDGATAFKYGSDNASFASGNGDLVNFDVNLLFTPIAGKGQIKLMALDKHCDPVFGYGVLFFNVNSDSNAISYNRATNDTTLNGQTQKSYPSGVLRYIWAEVWDGVNGSNKATYSYLVDIDNIRNPGEPYAPRPALIVPGIAGSELYDGVNLIWPDVLRMINNNDSFLNFALNLDSQGNSIKNISVGNIVKIVSVLGYKEDIFNHLIQDLNSSYQAPVFYFPYDWRLDLNSNIAFLNQRIQGIKAQTGFYKVDVVAHSMGGLLVKDYLKQYGNKDVDKLIFVGTPHLGAPKAAKILLDGDKLEIPWLDPDRVKELGLNSPAVYELLPNQKYFSSFQGYIDSTGNHSLLNYSATKQFLQDKGSNAYLLQNADNFFAKNLENLDLSWMQVFNIVGCAVNTQGAYSLPPGYSHIFNLAYTDGDKTVPSVSADYINIPASHKFYIKKGDHASLPSQDGVRQLILGVLQNSIPTGGNVSNSSSFCNFKGKELKWRSPVAVDIYDAYGNHAGHTADGGGIENNIPSADYEIINGEKFIFLPTDQGQVYNIAGKGEATGTFDLLNSGIDNGTVTNTAVFNDVPITNLSAVKLDVSAKSNDSTIKYDKDGSGVFTDLPASANLTGPIQDIIPPVSAVNISGTAGNNGWYKSSVQISLSATDDSSGVLETKYSLDNRATYSTYSSPITVNNEGVSSISFYSVDNSGNNETVQTAQVKIDKTPPELKLQYDLPTKTLPTLAIDNADPNPTVTCINKVCTIKDAAGNSTIINFSKFSSGTTETRSIKSIVYNNQKPLVLGSNTFSVTYTNVSNKITFKQSFKTLTDQYTIVYNQKKNQSTIAIVKSGVITTQVVSGYKFLQLSSKQGTLNITIK